MFKITPNGSNRLDIELSGKLDADEMKVALDDLVRKSEDIENGRMLYDVIDFRLPSIEALKTEFSRMPELMRLVKKFDRVAVLADKTWLKKVSELEGLFYAGLEIKAFSRDERSEAEAWLSL